MTITPLQKKMGDEYDIVCWRMNERPTKFYLNHKEFQQYMFELYPAITSEKKKDLYFRGTPVYKNTKTNFSV